MTFPSNKGNVVHIVVVRLSRFVQHVAYEGSCSSPATMRSRCSCACFSLASADKSQVWLPQCIELASKCYGSEVSTCEQHCPVSLPRRGRQRCGA